MVVFKFNVDGYDYNIFVSSNTDITCFKFGKIGHVVHACLEIQSVLGVSKGPGLNAVESDRAVPPVAAAHQPCRCWCTEFNEWKVLLKWIGPGEALHGRKRGAAYVNRRRYRGVELSLRNTSHYTGKGGWGRCRMEKIKGHTHGLILLTTHSLARLDKLYGFWHQLAFFTKCFIIPVGISYPGEC